MIFVGLLFAACIALSSTVPQYGVYRYGGYGSRPVYAGGYRSNYGLAPRYGYRPNYGRQPVYGYRVNYGFGRVSAYPQQYGFGYGGLSQYGLGGGARYGTGYPYNNYGSIYGGGYGGVYRQAYGLGYGRQGYGLSYGSGLGAGNRPRYGGFGYRSGGGYVPVYGSSFGIGSGRGNRRSGNGGSGRMAGQYGGYGRYPVKGVGYPRPYYCGVQWEYFEGSYYTLHHSYLPYTEAKAYCQGLCSYPVHVNSQAEMDYLKTINHGFWIGLERSEVTNEWFWGDDGSEVTFSNWGENQPGNQMCSFYSYNGKWYDYPCYYICRVICERK